MLKWMIGKFGGGSDTSPANDATAAWLTCIRKGLDSPPVQGPGGTWTWPAGFAERLVDHLASGGSTSVLTESDALGHALFTLTKEGDLYARFDALDPAVALRWARMLEHLWQAAGYRRQLHLRLSNGSAWAECLMLHATAESPNSYVYQAGRPPHSPVNAAAIERLLIADGLPAEAVLVASFNGVSPNMKTPGRSFRLIARSPDYAQAVDRHLESLRDAFATPEMERRLHLIDMLARVEPATLLRLGRELADFTVSTSKQVRQAVRAVVARAPAGVIEPLKQFAVQGSPEQRLHALRRLGELAQELSDDALASFARQTAAADKARSVRELADGWAAGDAMRADDLEEPATEAFAIDWSPAANAVAPALLDEFWRLADESVERQNHRLREWHAKNGKGALPQDTPLAAAAVRASLAACLASADTRPATSWPGDALRYLQPIILKIGPQLTPVAAFRLLQWFGVQHARDTLSGLEAAVFNAMHDASGRPSLIELASIYVDAGLSSRLLLRGYCSTGNGLARGWHAEAVAPFMAAHVADIEDLLLAPPRGDWYFDPARVYQAIATLHRPPPRLADALFRIALGSAKTERMQAQAALAALPGKEARIVAALADGKAATRQVAAEWIGRLRHAPAQAALEAAVAKEKNDVAKGAMLDALQVLGQPVGRYIDRAAIARDAPRQLAKGLPRDIDWFAWDALPAVHWADSGEAVPTDVLRWLLAQAVKQKSPEPNAVLRKLCGLFEPRDREALGQFVLEAWIAEDLRPIAPEVAHAAATREAQAMHRWINHSPQQHQDSPLLGKSVEEIVAYYLPAQLRQPVGSAIASKGLLAVAAACAAERAAAPVQHYLKQWYGMRAAQGRALIAMLAWIEHPSATQLMLAVGRRFRTKSFQEEATKQAEALAERKGWTLAELADRTIPSAGFDDAGTLELSFGERKFSARLLPDFKVELFNADGRKIAALPEPRRDDDAEAAKESRKALAAARKEIKSIVALQADRLHEALCTEREWQAADWRDYLLHHPVMRHLVQRLVWLWTDEDGTTQAFRPLPDGTLTSRDDEEIALPGTARVRLAHDSRLSADEVQAWRQHLVDYDVQPLFAQFGKGGFALPAERKGQTELKDFEGHMLEAFSLRGRATKLGYARGPTGDGGWFHTYEKRFPTLGLQAVIRFTGNPLPETNRQVALESLSFERTGAGSGQLAQVTLGDVPAVLLSECRDDLRQMAAEGIGFDPDWQKKSEY